MRALQAALIAAAAVTGVIGCGGDGGGSCPSELPASCPSPAPTFSTDANPIFQSYCVPACHNPTGTEPTHPLDSYANVRALISTVIMQVQACSMPPMGYPQLSNDQRRTLLGWASSCGAMDN